MRIHNFDTLYNFCILLLFALYIGNRNFDKKKKKKHRERAISADKQIGEYRMVRDKKRNELASKGLIISSESRESPVILDMAL